METDSDTQLAISTPHNNNRTNADETLGAAGLAGGVTDDLAANNNNRTNAGETLAGPPAAGETLAGLPAGGGDSQLAFSTPRSSNRAHGDETLGEAGLAGGANNNNRSNAGETLGVLAVGQTLKAAQLLSLQKVAVIAEIKTEGEQLFPGEKVYPSTQALRDELRKWAGKKGFVISSHGTSFLRSRSAMPEPEKRKNEKIAAQTLDEKRRRRKNHQG